MWKDERSDRTCPTMYATVGTAVERILAVSDGDNAEEEGEEEEEEEEDSEAGYGVHSACGQEEEYR